MPYVSRSQRLNDAVESGFQKGALIIAATVVLMVLFAVIGRTIAQRLYPHSLSAQKTVRWMCKIFGGCVTAWTALRIIYA